MIRETENRYELKKILLRLIYKSDKSLYLWTHTHKNKNRNSKNFKDCSSTYCGFLGRINRKQ